MLKGYTVALSDLMAIKALKVQKKNKKKKNSKVGLPILFGWVTPVYQSRRLRSTASSSSSGSSVRSAFCFRVTSRKSGASV